MAVVTVVERVAAAVFLALLAHSGPSVMLGAGACYPSMPFIAEMSAAEALKRPTSRS